MTYLNSILAVAAALAPLAFGTSGLAAACAASARFVRWHRSARPMERCGTRPAARRRSERGEGVISAAIAVLIIASLGALMWVGFKALWENAEETTNSEIAKIGK